MKDMMPCGRCGAMNLVGQRYCYKCGLRLHYSCPNCGTDVDNTLLNCPKCFRPLDWPTLSPRQMRRLVRETRVYEARARRELPGAVEREEGKKIQKKESPWSLGCLFPVALLLLIAGAVIFILLMD